MRLVARWGVAVVVSAAGFALACWVCQDQGRLDEGISLGIAGAVLAVLAPAVAAWRAPRECRQRGAGAAGGGLCRRRGRAGGCLYGRARPGADP